MPLRTVSGPSGDLETMRLLAASVVLLLLGSCTLYITLLPDRSSSRRCIDWLDCLWEYKHLMSLALEGIGCLLRKTPGTMMKAGWEPLWPTWLVGGFNNLNAHTPTDPTIDLEAARARRISTVATRTGTVREKQWTTLQSIVIEAASSNRSYRSDRRLRLEAS
jgi:hypothetical protein